MVDPLSESSSTDRALDEISGVLIPSIIAICGIVCSGNVCVCLSVLAWLNHVYSKLMLRKPLVQNNITQVVTQLIMLES